MKSSKILLTAILYVSVVLFSFTFASLAMTNSVIRFGHLKISISVNTMVASGFAASALFGGYLSEHYGKKPLFLGGLLIMALGTFTFGAGGHLAFIVASTLLFGAGAGLVEGLGHALIGDLYPHNRRSVFNSFQAFFSMGALVGAASVGIILEKGLNWRLVYMAVGGAGFVLFLVGVGARFPKMPEEHFDFKVYRSIIRRPVFILCAVMIFLYVGSEGFPAWWFPRFMKGESAASFLLLGGGLGLFWLGTSLSRIASSFIPRRFNTRHLLAICSTLSIAIFVLIYLVRAHEEAMLPLSFFLGFAMGPVWGTIQSVAVDHIPTRSGVVASAVAAFGSFGNVVNQPIIGSIGEEAGLPFALLYAAFLIVIILALLAAGRKTI
jgi:fucose permease